MYREPRAAIMMTCLLFPFTAGCTVKDVKVSDLERPDRSSMLNNYAVFVGSWNWTARSTTGSDEQWTGKAKWEWTLDERCLHGVLSARCGDTAYDTAGVWSWHPTEKKYVWWMFNNWGYPQEGAARYDSENKEWTMTYVGVGLDGTTSHGEHRIRVVDNDTLDWKLAEWVDGLRTIKKFEIEGTYTRQ
ncbi:MAG: hypothetical protein ACYTHJ_12280 [Planctomycetota bacterium]|jgi:hypothetical protein